MNHLDPDDLPSSPSSREHFNTIVSRVVSRRQVLIGGLSVAASMLLGRMPSAVFAGEEALPPMGFKPVAPSTGDTVVVAEGYEAYAIAPWGSPLFADSPAWKPDGSNTGADQARQVGDNHDGMSFVPFRDEKGAERSDEGLLVVNNEYTNYEYTFANEAGKKYPEPWTADKVLKAQNAHGVTIMHLRKSGGKWEVVVGSPKNRRITAHTPMEITGPAAGDAMMKTNADPTGRAVLGTFNNCANGWTPWGTYLTCEENINGYFGSTKEGLTQTELQKRYGVLVGRSRSLWELHDARFDIAKEPNEWHRFGWVVELDPQDAAYVPKKRTALGRVKHENAAVTLAADGRVVVYMGDDQAGEYVYKFVSAGKFVAGDAKANRDLLDSGTLYVARFSDGAAKGDMMGSGEWLALDREKNPAIAADARFASQAEVLVRTREAADVAGATRMDRPEWVAVHPETKEVFCTLTNNYFRAAADVNDANPREKNAFGQIIRWREAGGDPGSVATFEWDLFLLAGNPSVAAHAGTLKAGSANITAENTFNCPDGIGFSPDGRLWIQTDGNFCNTGEHAGQGNNQMLCADPKTREVRRFLVGPSGCEITGQAFTPDQRTLFISIQHPGETLQHPRTPKPPAGVTLEQHLAENPLSFSQWPDPAGGRPRSAILVVTKKDGGAIGS